MISIISSFHYAHAILVVIDRHAEVQFILLLSLEAQRVSGLGLPVSRVYQLPFGRIHGERYGIALVVIPGGVLFIDGRVFGPAVAIIGHLEGAMRRGGLKLELILLDLLADGNPNSHPALYALHLELN